MAQKEKRANNQPVDTANIRVTYQFSQQALEENETIIITDTMTLEIGKIWSIYYDQIKINRDSMRLADFEKNPPKSIALSSKQDALQARLEAKNEVYDTYDDSQGESMLIFKNRKDNEIITFDKGPIEGIDTPTNFKLIEGVLPPKWEITQDTCSILGYPCYKASTFFQGKRFIAWFTPEVPLNEGPWRLYGLPGLILKAEDNNHLFEMKAIGLKKIEPKNISFPSDKKVREVSRTELLKFRKNAFKYVKKGFHDGNGAYTFYKTKNPITYYELETED